MTDESGDRGAEVGLAGGSRAVLSSSCRASWPKFVLAVGWPLCEGQGALSMSWPLPRVLCTVISFAMASPCAGYPSEVSGGREKVGSRRQALEMIALPGSG
eukprot:5828282-Pyramimonas_sp.AAC.1